MNTSAAHCSVRTFRVFGSVVRANLQEYVELQLPKGVASPGRYVYTSEAHVPQEQDRTDSTALCLRCLIFKLSSTWLNL